MNNCPQCSSRNPSNATQCILCNASMSPNKPNAQSIRPPQNNHDNPTQISPVTGLVIFLIIAAIAFVFRDDLSNMWANSKPVHNTCVSVADRNAYMAQGYRRCVGSSIKCTIGDDQCYWKAIGEGDSKFQR